MGDAGAGRKDKTAVLAAGLNQVLDEFLDLRGRTDLEQSVGYAAHDAGMAFKYRLGLGHVGEGKAGYSLAFGKFEQVFEPRFPVPLVKRDVDHTGVGDGEDQFLKG